MLDKRLLRRMAAAQAFDGFDPCSVDVRERHQTTVDRRAVDEHRTGAALAFAAPFLGARQPQSSRNTSSSRFIGCAATVRRLPR
ncbi:MAG: hypothetical protein A3H97_20400 [Acidobacteria bacterium RIFCSPLOWO2_02_FULL_65_29]|nr:MAG: hypothetical protein A3H97_20400 [Acidobacteria bacterium RIFCSPLOWO2_02_FULL_65_29]